MTKFYRVYMFAIMAFVIFILFVAPIIEILAFWLLHPDLVLFIVACTQFAGGVFVAVTSGAFK